MSCGVDLRILPRSLVALGEVERVRSSWLEATKSELEVVEELMECQAYCCAGKGNQETMIAGKLVATNSFREQWLGMLLFVNPFRLKADAEGCSQKCVRRPLT